MGTFDSALFVDRDREIRGFDKLLSRTRPVVVMRIRAGESMGKTWLLERMIRRCRESGCGALVVEIDLRNRREIHELQDTLSLVRLLRDRIGRPLAFDHLNAVINSFTEPGSETPVSALASLAEKLEESYDLSELARLSHFMDVHWQNLPGDTLYLKAYELVGHLHRRDRLAELLDRLQAERSHVDWWQGWEGLRAPAAAAAAGPAAEQDRYAPLPAHDVAGRDLAERRINDAFFTCLADLARGQPIVFFLDGCEEAPDETETWVRLQLLDRLARRELEGVFVVLAGRPNMRLAGLSLDSLGVDTELDPFDQARVLQFFAAHGVPVPDAELPVLVRASGGNPGLLARMVDNLRAVSDKKDPFWDD